MHPVLFDINGFLIPTYGVTLALSILGIAKLMSVSKDARDAGMEPATVFDTVLTAILFGFLGSKLLLILIDLPYFVEDPRRLLGTVRSAGVLYGGVITGTIGTFWYLKRKQVPILRASDMMAPYLALAIGLGRIGCTMAGCCYGRSYDGPFALVYPTDPHSEAIQGVPLFPVQPLAVLVGIGLFFFLRYRLRRCYHFTGQILLEFFMSYGVARWLLELLRGDELRGKWFNDLLSTSQIIAMVMVAVAAVLYIKRKHNQRSDG